MIPSEKRISNKLYFILFIILCCGTNSFAQTSFLKINLDRARDDKFKVTFIPDSNMQSGELRFARHFQFSYFPVEKQSFIQNVNAFDVHNKSVPVSEKDRTFTTKGAVSYWEFVIDSKSFPDYLPKPYTSFIKRKRQAYVYPKLFLPLNESSKYTIQIKDELSSDSSVIREFFFEDEIELNNFLFATKKKLDQNTSIYKNVRLNNGTKLNDHELESIVINVIKAFENTTKQPFDEDFQINILPFEEKRNALPTSATFQNQISIFLEKDVNEFNRKEKIIRSLMWQLFRQISPLKSHDINWQNIASENGKHSIHLWYYESVTEYLSLISLLKNNLINESYFTQIIQEKVSRSLQEPSFSLIQIGKDISNEQTKMEIRKNLKVYDIFENRGIIASLLLDICLLKESGGNHGLMSKFLIWSDQRIIDSLHNENFINKFVEGHGYEVRKVAEDYILGIEQINYINYFSFIDWQFFRKGEVHKTFMKRGHLTYFPEIGKYVCTKAGKNSIDLKKGDIILSINNDKQISTMDLNEVILPGNNFRNENRVKVDIMRNGQTVVLKGKAIYDTKVENDIIIPLFNPNSEGYQLRKSLMY